MTPDTRLAAFHSIDALEDALAAIQSGRSEPAEQLSFMRQHLRALRTLVNVDIASDTVVLVAQDELLLACRRLRAMRRGGYEPDAIDECVRRVEATLGELEGAQSRALVETPLGSTRVTAEVAQLRSLLSVVEAYVEHENTCEDCRGSGMEACRDRQMLSSIIYQSLPGDLEPYDPASRTALTGQPL